MDLVFSSCVDEIIAVIMITIFFGNGIKMDFSRRFNNKKKLSLVRSESDFLKTIKKNAFMINVKNVKLKSVIHSIRSCSRNDHFILSAC